MVKQRYSDEDIRVLEGLEAVRLRPGMYIGSVESRGFHHLVSEIVDNAIDEALAGVCTRIVVSLHGDGSVSVQDNGRGIPTGTHEKTGLPTPQVIMTKLHAGGKFGGSGYKVSGGLHGVGASVVNALSSWLEVDIQRGGLRYQQRFEEGGRPLPPTRGVGAGRGTRVRFLPDPAIFGTQTFQYPLLTERLRELAYLNGGLEIVLRDLREAEAKEDVFRFEGGLAQLCDFLNEERSVLHAPIVFKGEAAGLEVECAIQYYQGYSESLHSYVNCISTMEGGTHEMGFRLAHTRCMNQAARRRGLWKKKDNLPGPALREGMLGILHVKLAEPLFEGQTKTRLGNAEARTAVESVVAKHLALFLEGNPDVACSILEQGIKAHKARQAARSVRDAVRAGKKGASRTSLGGKLTRCATRNRRDAELFIVEGESAGGTAKQGRDRKIQAILPLGGKPLNPEKASLERVLQNKELSAIVHSVGAGFGSEFDIHRSRYARIIILSDADWDGAHIRCLLLTFFYRYMRDLVAQGRVFVALPPLFKVQKKGKKARYAWEEAQMREILEQEGRGAEVQRYKGLGEMNPTQLWATTMNPKTRTLVQIGIEDAAAAEKRVAVLMGSRSGPRRRWLQENVAFGPEEAAEDRPPEAEAEPAALEPGHEAA